MMVTYHKLVPFRDQLHKTHVIWSYYKQRRLSVEVELEHDRFLVQIRVVDKFRRHLNSSEGVSN